MATEGWQVTIQYLEAFLELQQVSVTMDSFRAKGIHLSEDLLELVFIGVSQLVLHEGEDLVLMLRWMPYSNFYQREHRSQRVWSSNRDLGFLGVVIKKNIVGPQ